jgi:hypothetical protein
VDARNEATSTITGAWSLQGAAPTGGDVDGDGLQELLVIADYDVRLLWGAALPAEGSALLSELGAPTWDLAADAVAFVGDWDLDGGQEIAILDEWFLGIDGHRGALFILGSQADPYEGEQDIEDAGLTVYSVDDTARPGALASGADLDGDGLGDLLVADDNVVGTDGRRGGVWVVYGGDLDGGVISVTDAGAWLVSPEGYSWFADSVSMVGDLDGDGLSDWTAQGPYGTREHLEASHTVVVSGGTTRLSGWGDLDDVFIAEVQMSTSRAAGTPATSPAGDLDGDGRGELAFGAWTLDPQGEIGPGVVLIYHGPLAGSLNEDDATGVIVSQSSGANLGRELRFADLNGDGGGDLVASATGLGSWFVLRAGGL